MTHREEALNNIEWAECWQEHEGSTDATGIASALLAQAHATLELAEQQRIANLIALWQGSPVGGEFSLECTRTLFGERGHLHPEIAEALGIEDTK